MVPAYIVIIVVNVFFFFMQLTVPGFHQMLMLVAGNVLSAPWTVLTTAFLHGGFGHLFINMIGLYFFGSILEERLGTKRFVILYLGAAILASLIASLFYPDGVGLLGASGAVMGVMGVLVILMPRLTVMVNLIIPLPLWVACILWVLMDIFHIFVPTGIAGIAHLAGLGTGMAYGLYLKSKQKKIIRRVGGKHHLTGDDLAEYMRSGRV